MAADAGGAGMSHFDVLTVGSVCIKVSEGQSILIRNYFTGSYDEHAEASVICNRLKYMPDLCGATVCGISVVDESVCIDYFYDDQVKG